MTWTSTSSTHHPRDWRATRARVLARDHGRCQWPDPDQAGGVCGSGDRVEVDRRVPHSQGGSSQDANAWVLCHTHHYRKTAGEAHASYYARRHRPATTHPRRRARDEQS